MTDCLEDVSFSTLYNSSKYTNQHKGLAQKILLKPDLCLKIK